MPEMPLTLKQLEQSRHEREVSSWSSRWTTGLILNPKSLKASIQKYKLEVIGVTTGAGYDEIEDRVYIRFARAGSGSRGGHMRNVRATIIEKKNLPGIAKHLKGDRDLAKEEVLFLNYLKATVR